MKYLLDTHTFLWWVNDDPLISDQVAHIIKNPDHDIFFSVISAWEIAIKYKLKKLDLAEPHSAFCSLEGLVEGRKNPRSFKGAGLACSAS